METRGNLLLVVLCGGIVSSNTVKDSNRRFTKNWISKMKEYFDIVDIDRDGVVTKEEYIDLTTERAKDVLESWRTKAVYGILSFAYQTWWSNENTNYTTSITFKELLPALEKEVYNRNEALVQVSQDWFHTFDLDCDNKLTEDEYSNLIFIFRNTVPVKGIFEDIDQNGNGYVDGEEFLNGY